MPDLSSDQHLETPDLIREGVPDSVEPALWRDVCTYCHARDAVQLHDGDHLCSYCARNYTTQCIHCSELSVNATYHRGSVCGYLCRACAGIVRNCPMCDRPGFWTDEVPCCTPDAPRCRHCRRDGTTTDPTGRSVCSACYRQRWIQCSECLDMFNRTYTYHVEDRTYCPDCYNDVWAMCPTCDNPYRTDAGEGCCPEHDDDEAENGDCPCGECRNAETVGIRSYSYKPRPVFKGLNPHGVFLGWELELECRDRFDSARIANKALSGTAYLKEDGSISHGFEIVTHPMSYQWAMERFPWQLFDDLKRDGVRATDNCGLHVHVSKAGFANSAHDHRWLLFWHRNSEYFTKLARRDPSQWGPFRECDRKDAKLIAQKKMRGNGRYTAINSENEHTYEVRIFASTMYPELVQAALGLVDSTVEYTRKLRARDILHDGGWSWKAYHSWLQNQPQYQPLINQIDDTITERA